MCEKNDWKWTQWAIELADQTDRLERRRMDTIRKELDRRATEIDDKIAQLEAAQRVSRETMQLEFTI